MYEVGFFDSKRVYKAVEFNTMEDAMNTYRFYADRRQMFGLSEVCLIDWVNLGFWSTESAMRI